MTFVISARRIQTPVGKSLQVQEVSYVGFTDRATAQPLFKKAIRPSQAIMLTKVFRPGTHDKCFEITVGDLEVSTNSPSRCAVAAPDASVFTHGLDKLRYPLGLHVVFNRDQNRARIGIRIDNMRQAPMIPGR